MSSHGRPTHPPMPKWLKAIGKLLDRLFRAPASEAQMADVMRRLDQIEQQLRRMSVNR
jgi:hypothetical protein